MSKATTLPAGKRPSAETIDKIFSIIEKSPQPVTLGEIFIAQQANLGKSFSTISCVMIALVETGRVIFRDETDAERALRKGARGARAKFYAPASAGVVAPRTDLSVLPGVMLSHSAVTKTRRRSLSRPLPRRSTKNAKNTKKAKTVAHDSRPAKAAASVQTGNRIDRLERRIADLEAIVRDLRRVIN